MGKHTSRNRLIWAAALSAGLGSSAFGQFFTWTNAAGGTFNVASNWNPAGPPTLSTHTAIFNQPATYTVTFTAGAAHGTVALSAGTVSLNASAAASYGVSTVSLSGGTLNVGSNLTMNASGTVSVNAGSRLNIDTGGTFNTTQNVIINGGSLFRNSSNLSSFGLGAGRSLTVQGGGTASFTGSFDLDNNRSMTVTSGLITSSSFFDVGNGSNGTLTANGAAAQINCPSSTSFFGAAGGVGDVSLLNGSFGTFGGLQLGDASAGASGRLTVNGSTLNCNTMQIGNFGGTASGEFNMLGAAATTTVGGSNNIIVGSSLAAATTGTLAVSGGTFTTGTGSITVNPRGLILVSGGVFNALGGILLNGGTVSHTGGLFNLAPAAELAIQSSGIFTTSTPMTLAQNQLINITSGTLVAGNALTVGSGSNATLTLDGVAARATVQQASVVGVNAGTGTLLVSNSGAATFSSSLTIGFLGSLGGHGRVSLDTDGLLTAGTVNVATAAGTTGSILINGGTMSASAMTVGTAGIVQIAGGGRLNLSGPLVINGGRVERNTASPSALSQSAGQSIAITGNGALAATGTLSLPNGNSLLVSTGGDLPFSASTDTLNLGSGTATSGTLSISGTGSTVDLSSTFDSLYVGRLGGNGTANFSGGSNGTISFFEIADTGGSGTVNITGGAQVFASLLELTRNGSGTAVITIDGTGSRVDTSGMFADGSSTITVSNGGMLLSQFTPTLDISRFTINAGTVDLGLLNNHSGTVNLVSGLLKFTADLGSDATGLLGVNPVMAINQHVDVGGNVVLEPFTTVTLNGGELSCAEFVLNGGSFVWNAGTLNFTSDPGPVISDPSVLGNDVTLTPGRALGYTHTLPISVDGVLTVAGGRLSAPAFDLSGAFFYDGGPVLLGAGTVQSTGRFLVMPGRSLGTTGAITNFGRIEVLGSGARLIGPGSIANHGVLTGDGEIAKPLQQMAGGEIRVDAGKRLAFTGGFNTANLARITLGGGTLESTAALVNVVGATISGRGTIKAGGISNSGTIALSAGVSDVYSPVTNQGTGKTIISGGATVTFWDAVSNVASSELRISTNSTAVFFGPVTGASKITGAGTAVFESSAVAGPLVNGGRSVVGPAGQLMATSIRQQGLIIEGSTELQPSFGGAEVSRLNEFAIIGTSNNWDGTLNLSNNALLLDYTGASPLSTVANQLKQGFNNGAWNGNGINSSAAAAQVGRAIGFAEATAIGSPATFLGESIDGTTLILRFTITGDTDLSGAVNLDDFTRLAASFGTSSTWSSGDFTYDGVTNLDDFTALAANFGLSLPGDVPRSAVPEPAAGLAASAALLGLRRRVNRRS